MNTIFPSNLSQKAFLTSQLILICVLFLIILHVFYIMIFGSLNENNIFEILLWKQNQGKSIYPMMRLFSFLRGIGLCPYADALSFVGFSVIFVKSSFALRVCGFCGEADCFHPQVIDAHSSLVLTLHYCVAIDIETHSSLVLTLCCN